MNLLFSISINSKEYFFLGDWSLKLSHNLMLNGDLKYNDFAQKNMVFKNIIFQKDIRIIQFNTINQKNINNYKKLSLYFKDKKIEFIGKISYLDNKILQFIFINFTQKA